MRLGLRRRLGCTETGEKPLQRIGFLRLVTMPRACARLRENARAFSRVMTKREWEGRRDGTRASQAAAGSRPLTGER